MITAAQAQEYLDQVLGVGVPSFIIDAAIAKVATAEPAMDAAGYSSSDKVLIQSMAVALVSAAGDPRRLSSQGAVSGASRAFKYRDNDLTSLRRALLALDTAGTVADIVGPDPTASTLLFVTC